jgi:hypothetical protein
MKFFTRRRLVQFLIIVALVSGAAAAVIQWAIPDQPWCKVANHWASTVKAEDLPTDLAEFATVPKPYRLAIFQYMTSASKARIHKEAAQKLLDSGTLTARQVNVVRSVLAQLTPAFYDEHGRINKEMLKAQGRNGVRTDPLWGNLVLAALEIKELSKEQQLGLSPFTAPQAVPKRSAYLLPVIRSGILALLDFTRPARARTILCSCNSGMDYSDCMYWWGGLSALPCDDVAVGCEPTSWGCGPSGGAACTRDCGGRDWVY